MTNNAQLLPLPEGSLICWTPNPEGPCDIVYTPEQMQSYALACIEAAKPADEGWKTKAAFGMYSHDGKIIDVAKPADALGSLPVVAWMHLQREYSEPMPRRLDQDELNRGWTEYPLTDHAKATAEIARLHALSKEYFDKMNSWREAYEQVSKDCQNLTEKVIPNIKAKLAEVDGLVDVLRAIIDNGPFTTGQKALLNAGSAALATYEAAQETK